VRTRTIRVYLVTVRLIVSEREAKRLAVRGVMQPGTSTRSAAKNLRTVIENALEQTCVEFEEKEIEVR